jgi:hypothetical protein
MKSGKKDKIQVADKLNRDRKAIPQRLKPHLLSSFPAWLKPCPFQTISVANTLTKLQISSSNVKEFQKKENYAAWEKDNKWCSFSWMVDCQSSAGTTRNK